MYDYDPHLSIRLAQNHPDLFEMRACYNNVYHMVTGFLEELAPRISCAFYSAIAGAKESSTAVTRSVCMMGSWWNRFSIWI